MEQYIDKSAVVAEIENLLDKSTYLDEYDCAYRDGNNCALYALKDKLNTLEVKGVDLEEVISGLTVGWIEGEEYGELQNINTACCVTLEEVKEAMRCIYELGLKAKGK